MHSFLRAAVAIVFCLSTEVRADRSALALRAGGTIRERPTWISANGAPNQDLKLTFDESPYNRTKKVKGAADLHSASIRLDFSYYPAAMVSTKPSGCHRGKKVIPDSAVDMTFNGTSIGANGMLTFNGATPQTIALRLKPSTGPNAEIKSTITCKSQGQLTVTY